MNIKIVRLIENSYFNLVNMYCSDLYTKEHYSNMIAFKMHLCLNSMFEIQTLNQREFTTGIK